MKATTPTRPGAASAGSVRGEPLVVNVRDVPQPAAAAPAVSTAGELIRVEGEIRALNDLDDLWLHWVSEVGAVVTCAQALIFRAEGSGRWRLAAASSLAAIDRDAPLARWLDRLADAVDAQGHAVRAFAVADHADPHDASTGSMPLSHGVWLPIREGQGPAPMAAMLLAQAPWAAHHLVLARRLAEAYAHAALAIRGRHAGHGWRRRLRGSRVQRAVGAAALTAAMLTLVQVPLATLAPAEVAPAEPFVVAAPVAGVVERLLVDPSASVKAGQPLVQLVDTTLRSEFEVAEQRLEVARARTLRVQQAAVSDAGAKRELAIAQSEQAVAQAEREYAHAMLGKSTLAAAIDGVALFGDARDWMGRPVAVGEAILRVADPGKAEFQLRVPVADAVNVRVGLPVKVFLDAEPLAPRHATITRVAYKAEADSAGVTSFLVIARSADEGQGAPQLGLRGTAEVSGEKVSLAYYLLRRPITAVRQALGV